MQNKLVPVKSLITGHAKVLLHNVVTPIIKELPFVLVFLLLMGAWLTVKQTIGLFILALEPGYPWTHFFEKLSYLSIWFLFAFLLALLISKTNKFVKVLLYVVALLAYAIQHFLVTNFGEPISPTYILLLSETNARETGEFLNQYVFSSAVLPTLKAVSLYVLAIIVSELIWHRIGKRMKKIPCEQIITCCFIVPFLAYGLFNCGIYLHIAKATKPEDIRYSPCPDDPFSLSYASVRIYSLMCEFMPKFVDVTQRMDMPRLNDDADSLINIVLVIGESYIKWHSGLYDYPHQTTPHQVEERQNGRLFSFNDVVAPSNLTSEVLRNILNCNNSSSGEQWYQYPFFPALFKQAGYDVFLWDNQLDLNGPNAASFTLNSFLHNPEISDLSYTMTNKASFNYDAEIVEDFNNTVGELKNARNLVIFHLMGQHHDASDRYPLDLFSRFNADSIHRDEDYMKPEYKDYIAHYDNATLYNDYVISQIINLFKDDNTFLVYFPDHGEEVYDWRDQCCRDHGPLSANKLKYQYDIPFVLWCSDSYKNKHPEIVENIKNAIDRPFMSDNLCHMLFKVGGINTTYYRDTLDLLSPAYRCYRRLIHGQDYDRIRNARH